jgi:hypothetical protein
MPTLRLTDRELAAAVVLATSPGHALLARPDAALQVASLRQAGVVGPDGTLDEDAAATLRVVARPLVRVELRRADGDEERELRAWADEADAVTGAVGAGAVALERIERAMLPQALVRWAGLVDGPETPEDDDRVTIPVAPEVVLEARERVRAADARAGLDHVRAAGLDGAAADQAFALAECLQHAFVAQGSWREPDGEWHPGTVAALAAGPLGWWTFAPGSDGPLEPTDAAALSARVVGLLP